MKADKKMNFYTGITTVACFHAIFSIIEPYLPKVKYCRGTKRSIVSTKVRQTVSRSSLKKLSYMDEFLLTVIRLRL